jgi:hypothetical protein
MDEQPSALPPVAELQRFLRLFHHAFITIRNHGLQRRADEALFCGYVGDALHNVPDLLLRYAEFDQEHWEREIRILRQRLPRRLQDSWDALFREFYPSRTEQGGENEENGGR